MGENADPSQADLERARVEVELRIKEAELALKQAELKAKLEEKPQRISASSPLAITVITGMLGLIGAGAANFVQSRSNLALEREKFESSLILKAIETGNPEAASKNLLFLVDTKLINDPSGSIAKLRTNPQNAPVLAGAGVPIPQAAASREAFFSRSRDEFLKRYAAEFGPPETDVEPVLTTLFSFIAQDQGVKDVRHVAYILATIKWETGDKWQPITELGSDSSLEERYGPDKPTGRRLGNNQPGDGARYRGRGYIQLTGRVNYQRLNQSLGLAGSENDLVAHPEKALDPLISYRITSHIMVNGAATGKKLSDFINDDKTDYRNARRIVDGLNQADEIAAVATKLEAILRASLQGN